MLSYRRMSVPYEYTCMGVLYAYGPICTYGAEHKYCVCVYTRVLSKKPTHVWITPPLSHACDMHVLYKIWVICTVVM